ncbi:MAG: flagellar biosynthesis protein FlhB [Anaerolineae bacterium]|nr:flagellar biosynthesis protein FlhB [Anaerolineae bacterium]
MADRTEAPTPRRRQEARERGEIARSQELSSAVGMTAAFTILRSVGPATCGQLSEMAAKLVSGGHAGFESPEGFRALLLSAGAPIALSLAPLMGVLMLSGVLVSVAQTGLYLSGHSLRPNLARLNPLAGMRRIFSSRSLVELAKQLAKIALIGAVCYPMTRSHMPGLVGLARVDLNQALTWVWQLTVDMGVRVGLVMIVLALADYVYERRQHEKRLRMTRQEVIEEMKRYENPFIRARIRQQQRRVAMQRMMASVPKADVVITNPTHLAVALQYDPKRMGAPVVVAKGQRLIAERIRELALRHGVPVVERRPLAQALYGMVEVGMEVPSELYQAVAEVLAFIYSLRGRR